MSTFWHYWIIILTGVSLLGFVLLLYGNRKTSSKEGEQAKTGHVYDGIEEYDNPLPSWWFKLFIGSIIYGLFYLAAYPGLGNFKGLLGWTSINQWEKEVSDANDKYGAIFSEFAAIPITELALNDKAMKMGQRMFANNCSTCHGVDASGALGYPNLTDKDWLYGGNPEQIKATITSGRIAIMPAWGAVLSSRDISAVAEYVQDIEKGNDENHAGQKVFAASCVACHGVDATGNVLLGAPNLADDIWLYGDSKERITRSITKGRNGIMPAHTDILGEERIHIVAAYVYSLSLSK